MLVIGIVLVVVAGDVPFGAVVFRGVGGDVVVAVVACCCCCCRHRC